MRKKAEAAARILPDLSGSALKVVRVAVDEVRARVLTDRFELLTGLLDGVELELISSHQHVNHQSRSIELQIRNCLPETDTLIARKIGELAYAVYGSADYVAKHPASRTPDRYKLCTWLGFAPDDLWYPSQMRWLETRLAQMPKLRSNTMTTLMNMTASGAGLCLLPVFMGDSNRELVRLTEPLAELTNVEHIIVHRDLRREPAVRQAMDAIAEVFRHMGPQLRGSSLNEPVAAAE